MPQYDTKSAITQESIPPPSKKTFTPLLQHAMSYAQLGFRMIPIPSQTKAPLLKGWVDKASSDPTQLKRWFQAHKPQNIGVATGKKSGLVVLDVDIKQGVPGEQSLQALLEQHGPLPHTPRVRTGSGGLHYFFAYPKQGTVPTVHATARGQHPLGAGLDLQSDGAQVVLPPSVHPNGQAYQWEVSPQQVPLAPLPDWLFKLVTQPPASPELDSPPNSQEKVVLLPVASVGKERRRQHYALTALQREAAALAQAPKGTRNNTLNTACVCLGGFLPTGLLTEDQIVQAMLQACQQNGYLKDKGRRAVMATVQSGLKKGQTSPRDVPERSSSYVPQPIGKTHAKASKPANRAKTADWMNLLSFTQKGFPYASLANAATLMSNDPRWKGVIAKDRRADQILLLAPPPCQQDYQPKTAEKFPRPFKAEDVSRCAIYLQRTYGVQFGFDTLAHGFAVAADKYSLDPVQDYLDSLTWDGTRRIDSWLCTYLKAQQCALTHAMGTYWLISAVARTYQPGCQADHMLVLEGTQGIGKSSALKILFSKKWFADELAEIGTKDASLQMRVAWVVELSELEALNKSQITSLKAFISRDTDHYRAPYAKQPQEYPRRCVFAGTTNESTYLRDSTGDRRFWPVRVGVNGPLELAQLLRDRDQLWAEAVSRYKAGEAWHLTDPELIQAAQLVQSERYQRDEWETLIEDYCRYRDSVTIGQILDQALEMRKDQWNRAHQMRVSAALRRLGWERRRARDGEQRMFRYYPPSPN